MKKQFAGLSLLLTLSTFTIISCVKPDLKTDIEEDYDTEATIQSDDQTQFSAQLDAVANETNLLLETTGTFALRGEEMQNPPVCSATVVVDSSTSTRTLTITYNGADCMGYFNRTGTVTVSIPAGVHWKNAGAAINISYQNLVVTRIIDNKKITINGSHVLTNVSGGLLVGLAGLPSITHSITSTGMTIKFGDNTTRTWQVSRQRVFTYNNGLVITTTGTHSDGTNTNIAEWGTNRFGNSFTSSITAPLVVRQDCNFRLVSGQVKHSVPLFTATATFGLNEAGNPGSCPAPNGHYYVKITWTGLAGIPHTALFPY
jgi:hypothetical protein